MNGLPVKNWRETFASMPAQAVFVHRASRVQRDESVAGPYRLPEVELAPGLELLLNSTVPFLRVHESEVGRRHPSREFEFYEAADQKVLESRRVADQNLRLLPWSPDFDEMSQQAAEIFATVVQGLFRLALCSMTRIVLSAAYQELPGITFVTLRDQEKDFNRVPEVAVATVDERSRDLVSVHVKAGAVPTSSVLMAAEFHRLHGPGVLLHAHLVAPVAVGTASRHLSVLKESPRTRAFASELAQALRREGQCALRPQEGIWTAASSGSEVLRAALRVQSDSLELIGRMGGRV